MAFSFNKQTLSIIASEFSRLLDKEVSEEQVRTVSLLKDDAYFGRKFQVENVVAIWQNTQPEIEFYDAQTGAALSSLNLTNVRRHFAA